MTYSFLRSVVNSLFDVILGSSVELAESLQKECLLLVVGEGKSLDGLGGVDGTLLDRLGRDGSTLGSPLVLGDGGGLVDGLVSKVELVNLSESLVLLGFSLLSGETDGRAACGLIVETSEVQSIRVEALFSGFSSLGLNLEGGVTLGQ